MTEKAWPYFIPKLQKIQKKQLPTIRIFQTSPPRQVYSNSLMYFKISWKLILPWSPWQSLKFLVIVDGDCASMSNMLINANKYFIWKAARVFLWQHCAYCIWWLQLWSFWAFAVLDCSLSFNLSFCSLGFWRLVLLRILPRRDKIEKHAKPRQILPRRDKIEKHAKPRQILPRRDKILQ